MSKTKHAAHAMLGAVSILAIGIVLGVLVDRVILNPSALAADVPSAESELDATHEGFLRGLQEDLGLTEVQASRVHEIMSRHQAAVNDAWSTVHARLAAAIDSVTAEIEAVLDPGQRAGLHEWLVERHGVRDAHTIGEGH